MTECRDGKKVKRNISPDLNFFPAAPNQKNNNNFINYKCILEI